MSTHPVPRRLRGCAVGASTASLAVAAHGIAGGGYPNSTALTLLLIAGTAIGAVAAAARGGPLAVIGLLGAGQLASHLALTVALHHETAATRAHARRAPGRDAGVCGTDRRGRGTVQVPGRETRRRSSAHQRATAPASFHVDRPRPPSIGRRRPARSDLSSRPPGRGLTRPHSSENRAPEDERIHAHLLFACPAHDHRGRRDHVARRRGRLRTRHRVRARRRTGQLLGAGLPGPHRIRDRLHDSIDRGAARVELGHAPSRSPGGSRRSRRTPTQRPPR